MKAIVREQYGTPDSLQLRDVARPIANAGEVLVRVHAASVHPDVWHVVRGVPYILRLMGAGLVTPKVTIPGTDMAGLVEVIGPNVTRFQPGDAVFGECVRGIQWKNGGAFAEYVAVPEGQLELKPVNLSFEQAAAVPTSGLIALQGIRYQGHVQAGQKILINGAGGGVGVFAVQIAKAYGAHVTGVDSTSKLDLMRSLGADHVIDYTQEDFTTRGERYDVILDIPGNHSIAEVRQALTPTGTYVLIAHDGFGSSRGRWFGSLPRFIRLLFVSPFASQQLNPGIAKDGAVPLLVLKELIEAGTITPVIDRTFPLSETIQAIRYLELGQACGKIVITM